MVLIGDAAHATFPFFGQGMNIAMEDAQILAFILQFEGISLARKVRAFSSARACRCLLPAFTSVCS